MSVRCAEEHRPGVRTERLPGLIRPIPAQPARPQAPLGAKNACQVGRFRLPKKCFFRLGIVGSHFYARHERHMSDIRNLPKRLYLVKITRKKEFAESLLDGNIYMSPLSDFALLDYRDDSSKNDFRGDTSEGLSETFPGGIGSHFIEDMFGGVAPPSLDAGQIAECFLQERIFSLYSLYWDEKNKIFEAPSTRLVEFGETAVIIFNPRQFLYRVFMKALSNYGNSFWMGARHVSYDVDFSETRFYDEFSKSPSYSWQNEFRLAIDVNGSNTDRFAWSRMTDLTRILFINQGGKVSDNDHCSIIIDAPPDQPKIERIVRNPVVIEVGSIRDIALSVPTEKLIGLEIPFENFDSPPIAIEPISPPRKPVVTSYTPIIRWI